MINENLLQYIWQFRYLNTRELFTTGGEPLHIIHPGTHNKNQGPDFLHAKIKIGNTTWVGHVELHLHTSDWNDHGHSRDKNYSNVILHVVWENDIDLQESFPTMEMKNIVSKILLQKYKELMNAKSFIACEKSVGHVPAIIWNSWKERLLIERLQNKTERIFSYLQNNNNHWNESFWWLLARNMGAKVNADAFEKIAQSIPINLLAKHNTILYCIEAILFGQAGFLDEDFKEEYPQQLRREYLFYQHKCQLSPIEETIYFLRMRPSNFPTIRLAQLAMLMHTDLHLFDRIKENVSLKDISSLLSIKAGDYWHTHYVFGEASAIKEKQLGKQMINSILINTIVPILFAYGQYHNEQKYKDKAIKWMEEIEAEKNAVTDGFVNLGIDNKNAFDSQALIQLKSGYCDQKKCLVCAAGNKILSPKHS